MSDDIKTILMNHEKRITALEVQYKSINGWLKNIDKKLDTVSEDLAFMKGEFSKLKRNGNSIDKKTLITIITTQATTIFLLIMVLVKVI